MYKTCANILKIYFNKIPVLDFCFTQTSVNVCFNTYHYFKDIKMRSYIGDMNWLQFCSVKIAQADNIQQGNYFGE